MDRAATMTPGRRLRQLIETGDAVMAPGVADPLFARLVAQHGFDAVYMTGAGTSATRLGMPDVGLLTMTEMVDNAARIVGACGLPVVADCDNGYGGPLNVRRAVQEYERAGVAAIHLEDQVLPKRCGHLAGKQLVSAAEMSAKIRAAVDARRDADFLLIARTDALAVDGLERALERAALYAEAGADLLFVEAPGPAEVGTIPGRLPKPAVYNMATSGKTPFLGRAEIAKLGYRLILYPNWLLLAAIKAAASVLGTLKRDGTIAGIAPDLPDFRQFFDLVGMQEIRALEERYGVPEDSRLDY